MFNKHSYLVLLIINNLVSLFFLFLFFLGAPSIDVESENAITETGHYTRLAIYAVAVTTMSGYISIVLTDLFSSRVYFHERYSKRLFIGQVTGQLLLFIMFIVYLMIRYPG